MVILTKKDHLASSLHVAHQQEASAQQAREKASQLRYQQLQMRCLEAEATASKSEKRVVSLSSANHLFSAKLEKREREAENAEQKMRHAEFVKEQADARANSIQGAANEQADASRRKTDTALKLEMSKKITKLEQDGGGLDRAMARKNTEKDQMKLQMQNWRSQARDNAKKMADNALAAQAEKTTGWRYSASSRAARARWTRSRPANA